MIQLERYTEEFENEYWNAVNIATSNRIKILKSCKKYLPPNFFDGRDEEFKTLILAPLEKIKQAVTYITNNTINTMMKESFRTSSKKKPQMRTLYKKVHDSYSPLANSEVSRTSMRVRIVRNAGLSVCPYCNRDYINSRADSVSGAQLDHFFNRSTYPLFSICLYNLIPVCGTCNRVKGNQTSAFASPFDASINWSEDLTFSYQGSTLADLKIVINANGDIEHNINGLRLREAYQIHTTDVLELIEKQQMYSKTQRDELREVLDRTDLTDLEMKKVIFGPEITSERMKTKPLAKLMYNIHKELKIYT